MLLFGDSLSDLLNNALPGEEVGYFSDFWMFCVAEQTFQSHNNILAIINNQGFRNLGIQGEK